MINTKIKEILGQNDRKGERAIALLQANMAFTVFLLHIIAASRNQWLSLSGLTIGVAAAILFASLIRVRTSYAEKFSNLYSHILTVVDGVLIFTLILSYNLAYDLPLEATFKTPTIIFLGVYTVVRIVRSDPWAIIVAGLTALTGWLGIFAATIINKPNLTTSYAEYMTSDKLLIGAVFEIAIGFGIIVCILAYYTKSARQFLVNTAHVEDLAYANMRAEENILIFEELLNSSVDGIVIVDRNGVIERINPAIETLFGYNPDELIGNNVSLLMSAENAHGLKQAIEHYMKTEQSELVGHSFESIGVKKDGTAFNIELSISEFFASGRTCFAGFIRDTTIRTQALANEKRAKAQFENALNAAMDAIIIIDQDGFITNFNPAAEEIFGHKWHDIAGKRLSDVIIPHRYRNAHDKGMDHYLNTGEGPVLNNRIEIEGLHASGKELQIELAIREIEGATGKLFIGYARDITERKTFETQLLAAKNSAEIATRTKTRFLAMMSHEIRTPLNGVLGIHGLLKETKLDYDQKQLLETASQSGESLLSIINDLLDFSKLEAGKFEIEQKPFVLRSVVQSVVNLIQPHADEKNLHLGYTIDDDIAPHLLGDAARIRQILLNLSWNAIKFTHHGSVDIHVSSNPSDTLTFMVRDTGIGIPADQQKDLFTEFTTLNTDHSNKFGGTGLGLAICKALVETMDGEIDFSSSKEAGSKFWFTLKLEVSDDDEIVQSTQSSLSDHEAKLSGIKVLVAEDNKTNQLVTSRYLKHLGCHYTVVENGIEAVNKIQDEEFDLVLMDVSMPKMNGIEATQRIRHMQEKTKASIPIIAFTAYASKEDQDNISKAGMNGFIPKPFKREELAKVLLQHLDLFEPSPSTANKTASQEPSYFDMSVLNTILDDMDGDAVTQIFSEFKSDAKRYAANAEIAVTNKDAEILEKASHGLQGVSGMFGAAQLSKLASQINQMCCDDNPDGLYDEAVRLIKLTHDIIESTEMAEKYFLEKTGTKNHD